MSDRAFKAYRGKHVSDGKPEAGAPVLFIGVVRDDGSVEASLADGPSDFTGEFGSVDDLLESARSVDADPQIVYEG